MPLAVRCFPSQEVFRILGSHPAALLGDADGHDIIFFLVDRLQDRGRGKQGYFMFAAAATEQYPNSQLMHDANIAENEFGIMKSKENCPSTFVLYCDGLSFLML